MPTQHESFRSRSDIPSHTSTAPTAPVGEQSAHALNEASLPPAPVEQPVSINLDIYEKAIARLDASPLHAEVLEHFKIIKEGTKPLNMDRAVAALHRIDAASGEQLDTLLHDFFAIRNHNPACSSIRHYASIVTKHQPWEEIIPHRANLISRCVLERGTLPPPEVALSAKLTSLSLLDTDRDSFLAFVGGLAIAGGLVATGVASPFAGISVCAILAAGLWFLNRQPNMHNEIAAGYLMENLDAFNAMFTGSVTDIGYTIHSLFADPKSPENHGNLWRANGFVIARTLRVLGVSKEDIYEAVRDSITVEDPEDSLMQLLSSTLEGQSIKKPSSMLAPYVDGFAPGEDCTDIYEVLSWMNYVHFSWAARETLEIRRDFAEAVLRLPIPQRG